MRFGLFSSAAPLAISDDSMFPDKKGKFQTSKMKPKFDWMKLECNATIYPYIEY